MRKATLTERSWLWAAITLLLLAGCRPAPRASGVGPVQVGPFAAVIGWSSDRPARYRLLYGEGSVLDGEIRENQPAVEHRVMISGLTPSTRYSFRLEPGGISGIFRTAPGPEGSFDLAISRPDLRPSRREGGIEPDLLLITGETVPGWTPPLPAVLTVKIAGGGARVLHYGPWRVVAAADIRAAAIALDDPETPVGRVILVLPELPEMPPGDLPDAVIASPAGVFYRGMVSPGDGSGLLRLEVDVFEVVLVLSGPDGPRRQVVVAAPPETKKSCLYCDRLLEQGRYQESLDWYREFVRRNREDYAVEEAFFSIARILDQKLFDYPRALAAYREFESEYPGSRRLPLVKNRVNYLRGYSDYDYRPLGGFERIKAELPLAGRSESAARADRLLQEFPGAKIREEVLAWAARLLEIESPGEAEEYYRRLAEDFPDSGSARVAAIARGDIRYRAGRYGAAAEVYRAALETAPQRYRIALGEKIHRSLRNRRREIYRRAAEAVLLFWLVVTFLRRPRRFSPRDLVFPGALLALAALAGGAYFALTYERSREALGLVAALVGGSIAVMAWNRIWAGSKERRGAWLVFSHMVSCSAAAAFLVLYHFHSLYLFGL